jgi:hypothetical protein
MNRPPPEPRFAAFLERCLEALKEMDLGCLGLRGPLSVRITDRLVKGDLAVVFWELRSDQCVFRICDRLQIRDGCLRELVAYYSPCQTGSDRDA